MVGADITCLWTGLSFKTFNSWYGIREWSMMWRASCLRSLLTELEMYMYVCVGGSGNGQSVQRSFGNSHYDVLSSSPLHESLQEEKICRDNSSGELNAMRRMRKCRRNIQKKADRMRRAWNKGKELSKCCSWHNGALSGRYWRMQSLNDLSDAQGHDWWWTRKQDKMERKTDYPQIDYPHLLSPKKVLMLKARLVGKVCL